MCLAMIVFYALIDPAVGIKNAGAKNEKQLCLILALTAGSTLAADLPTLPSQKKASPHKLFLSSETNHYDFDTWKIDGGYSYNLFNKIDFYVGARINQSTSINESGF